MKGKRKVLEYVITFKNSLEEFITENKNDADEYFEENKQNVEQYFSKLWVLIDGDYIEDEVIIFYEDFSERGEK